MNKKGLTFGEKMSIIYYCSGHADVAELADALDSGSSGHCARAGSSPVIRSNAETVISRDITVFCIKQRKINYFFEVSCISPKFDTFRQIYIDRNVLKGILY